MFQRTILISSTNVFVCVYVFELLLIHKSLLHLLSFIFARHRSWTLLRSMFFHTMFSVSNLICISTRSYNVTSLWSKSCIELICIFSICASKAWKLIWMNLCHHTNLYLIWMNIIWLSTLMNLILFISSRNIIFSI